MDKETNFLMLHNKGVFACLHSIVYLLQTSHKPLSNKQITALLYLADKEHLIRYGRTITECSYFTYLGGFFNPTIKNILFLEELDEDIVKHIQNSLEIIDLAYRSKEGTCNFEMLSETDRNVIEFIVKNFTDTENICNYVLSYPEMSKYKSFFNKHPNEIKEIKIKDMFSIIDNKMDATKEDIELAEDLYFNP